MEQKIVKVTKPITRLEHVRSIGVIGDPGCEGLGTYNMKVYAGALEETGKDGITLIVGDLVPAGTGRHYRAIQELTEALAENPVYSLRGNHDTGAYAGYFGLKNYALLLEGFAVIVLDNAARFFEEEGLSLLKQVLSMEEVRQAVIAFHIPVPNHFIRNCVSEEEFSRLKSAYTPWKGKVRYLLCGHGGKGPCGAAGTCVGCRAFFRNEGLCLPGLRVCHDGGHSSGALPGLRRAGEAV